MRRLRLAVSAKLSHVIARRRHGEETVTSSPSWRLLEMILRKLFAAILILAACTAFGATAQAQAQPWPSRHGEDRRPLRGRRQFGCDGARRRPAPHGTFRPDLHRGEPRRRQWRAGRGHGGEVAGRWLHPALGGHAADDDRSCDGQAQSRSDQGFRADQRGRDQRLRARGATRISRRKRSRNSSPT